MKDTVFYFNFFNEDTDQETIKGFIIKNYENIEAELTVLDDLESEYGVHDWSSRPDPRVNGIGFTSYEVDEALYDELMNNWREYFVSIVGEENVTQVFTVSMMNDYEIYVHFLSKL